MAVPTSSLPGVGVDARSISDQKIYNALQELQGILTAGVDTSNVNASAAIPASKLVASTLPGYEVGYDQTTSNVSVVSSTEASGTTVISCAAHTFDGAPVIVDFFSYSANTNGGALTVSLFEGATQIGRIVAVTSSASVQQGLVGRLRFTPSAGAHTYTVTAIATNPNGTISAGAGGTGVGVPAFVRFTKV